MTLYRRGSVTVEAISADNVMHTYEEGGTLPDWVMKAIADERLAIKPNHIDVKTIEGWSTADRKSWIVQRQTEHGELYAIPGKAFEERYTRVD